MELMDVVKLLRKETGLSLRDCKSASVHALDQTNGSDDPKALLSAGVDFLRTKGKDKAMKKGSRSTAEGSFMTYVHHNGKIGVLVEINCETDFVARNDNFKQFQKDIAIHIAGAAPVAVSSDSVPAEVIAKEKEIYKAQVIETGKPEAMHDKIIEGKLNSFFKDRCLLNQAMMTDQDGRSVNENLEDMIAKSGENIVISRFVRWELGK